MKLYFFDFDRTLCTHGYPKCGDQELSYFEECVLALTKQEEMMSENKPLFCMKWFINKLREKGDCKLFCITHEIFNLRDNYKKNFLKEHYGNDIEYFTVDAPEHKPELILAVAKKYGCCSTDCYLIEDNMGTIHRTCNAHINGIHISNIVAMYDEYLSNKNQK